MLVCDIQKHFLFWTSETGPFQSCENGSRAGYHNVVTQYNTLDDGWSPKEDSVWMVVGYIPWELNSLSFLVFTNLSVCLVPLSSSLWFFWLSYQYTFFKYAHYNCLYVQLCEICRKICCCVITSEWSNLAQEVTLLTCVQGCLVWISVGNVASRPR